LLHGNKIGLKPVNERECLANPDKHLRFERLIMPHLDAAHNLARWLARNDDDAQEIAQEALLRAYKFFDSFRGTEGRAWLLTIVRNTCYTLRGQDPGASVNEEFDEQVHLQGVIAEGSDGCFCRNPEEIAIENADCKLVNRAIAELPTEFREVLVLRELEELSYKEIAKIVGIPLGTVMSRLARARGMLQKQLATSSQKE